MNRTRKIVKIEENKINTNSQSVTEESIIQSDDLKAGKTKIHLVAPMPHLFSHSLMINKIERLRKSSRSRKDFQILFFHHLLSSCAVSFPSIANARKKKNRRVFLPSSPPSFPMYLIFSCCLSQSTSSSGIRSLFCAFSLDSTDNDEVNSKDLTIGHVSILSIYRQRREREREGRVFDNLSSDSLVYEWQSFQAHLI